jgi:NADPH:quinone reductase-like Zn-dependent oxidoreductase
MKAVNILNGAGPPEALFIDDIPDPEVTGDKILVRIYAFGLNRMDLTQREDKYLPMKPEWGNILGVEFSGIVEAKGPGGKK